MKMLLTIDHHLNDMTLGMTDFHFKDEMTHTLRNKKTILTPDGAKLNTLLSYLMPSNKSQCASRAGGNVQGPCQDRK